MGRRGQPGRAGQPALADPDAAPHPSVFLWANGSDGSPRRRCCSRITRILSDLHWPNAIVDTVSSIARSRRASASGTASRWPARTVGDRRATGSADATRATRGVDRRTGRQRKHPAAREPEEVHPRRQAVAIQRHMVRPRRLGPEKRCVGQHSAGDHRRYGPPTMSRSSRARRSLPNTNQLVPSSRRSPRTAGTPTR